jgi:hypothetical protein
MEICIALLFGLTVHLDFVGLGCLATLQHAKKNTNKEYENDWLYGSFGFKRLFMQIKVKRLQNVYNSTLISMYRSCNHFYTMSFLTHLLRWIFA